jgi:hypothetical protein
MGKSGKTNRHKDHRQYGNDKQVYQQMNEKRFETKKNFAPKHN